MTSYVAKRKCALCVRGKQWFVLGDKVLFLHGKRTKKLFLCKNICGQFGPYKKICAKSFLTKNLYTIKVNYGMLTGGRVCKRGGCGLKG